MNQALVQGASQQGMPVIGHPVTAAAFAARITERWRASVESIIEAGRILVEAKAALEHGDFLNMVRTELPFSERTAQMLMAIAKDRRLSNPQIVSYLPAAWSTLYELTDLTDEEFKLGIEQRIIQPNMIRADVTQLRPLLRGPSSDGGVEGHAYEQKGQGIPKAIEASSESERGGGKKVLGAGIEPGPSEAIHAHVPIVGLNGEWHCQTCGDAIEMAKAQAVSLPNGARAIAPSRIEPDDSLDFFPTPPWATRALIEHVFARLERRRHCKFQSAWEPACGQGHMAEVLREYFKGVVASDVDDRHDYGHTGLNFLTYVQPPHVDWIITNPPFGDKTEAFVLKAIELAGTGVAMFVRLQWLESVGRYERIFRDNPPTLISFFAERVPLHKDRWEPDGDTLTAYIWLVWIKSAAPQAPFWIPPGCRERLTKPEDAKRFTKHPVIKRAKSEQAA